MKISKIFAGMSALALAAAMSMSASAAITSDIPDSADDGSGNYQIFLVGDGATTGYFADVDVTAVDSFDITFNWTVENEDTWAGGAIVLQSDSLGWFPAGSVSNGQWSSADDGKDWSNAEPGKAIHVDMSANHFAADDGYACITIQSYGVDVTIDDLVLYDAAGNVLAAYPEVDAPAADPEPDPEPVVDPEPDSEPTADPEPDPEPEAPASDATTTTNPEAGAAAGIALAGIAVAGAAFVATKKR